MSQDRFIHIGFQKSGSTTLQQNYFSKTNEFVYYGRKSVANDNQKVMDLLRQLKFYRQLEYSREQNWALQNIIDDSSGSEKIVISDEGLTNSRWSDVGQVADRLHALDEKFRVIVVIRKQVDLIRSFYDMSPCDLFCFGSKKLIPFEQWLNRNREHLDRSFLLSLHFDRVIEQYMRVFGARNVRVLLFEDFVEDKRTFVQDLTEFLETSSEKALSLLNGKHENRAKHSLEHLLKDQSQKVPSCVKKAMPERLKLTIWGSIKRLRGTRTTPSTDARRTIEDMYRESNLNMADLGVVDKSKLERYGYIAS